MQKSLIPRRENPFKTYKTLISKKRLHKHASILYVLPMFTVREDIQKSIGSIKKQKGVDCDILFIDDKGTNYTKILSLFPDLNYVVMKKSVGSAGGFQIGGEIAYFFGYKYVIFGDDEVVLLNGTALQNMKMVLDTEIDCGAVGPDSSMVTGTKKKPLIPTRGLGSFCMFVKTEVFEKVGFYHMDLFWLGDDVDFSLRIAKHYKTYLVPQAKYFHPWLKPGKIENFSIFFILRNLLYVVFRSPGITFLDRLQVLYFFLMKLGAVFLSSVIFTDATYLHTALLAFVGVINLRWPLHKYLFKNNYCMIPLGKKPKEKATLLGSFSVFKKHRYYYTYLQLHKKQYYELVKRKHVLK